MNVLVVGYGSIGERHARILSSLGCRPAVVSARAVDFPVVHSSLAAALAAEHPECVIIANATSQHHDTLAALAELGFAGSVLVEKPIFDQLRPVPSHRFRAVVVGYNLRFHPVIQRLVALLEGEKILSVQAYAGQYLPEWRPGTDYRRSYSAHAAQGGGVLRDLSHELDYLLLLVGTWQRVSALGGHLSPLEIESDDIFTLTMVAERCPIVSVQLNYLDRQARRQIIINTAGHTIEADLIRGTVTVDRESQALPTARDHTYCAMHEALLAGRFERFCSLGEGLEVLRLIEAGEAAAATRQWVSR